TTSGVMPMPYTPIAMAVPANACLMLLKYWQTAVTAGWYTNRRTCGAAGRHAPGYPRCCPDELRHTHYDSSVGLTCPSSSTLIGLAAYSPMCRMNNNAWATRWTTHAMPVARGLWRLRLGPGLQISPDRDQWHRVHRGPHSRIYRVEGERPYIAKLIVPRSQPRDSIRKYGLCQAWRET